MKPGRYAAPDGSFGRSAGGAVGRGLALLAVALVIGIVLLNRTDADPPGTNVDTSSQGRGDTGTGTGTGSTTTTTTLEVTPPTLAAHAPKDVKVIVANAAGVQGVAARVKDQLAPAAYNVVGVTNLPNTSSSVYFVPEYEGDAVAVATLLQFPVESIKPMPTPPPVTDTKGAHVLVVVGTDKASLFGGTTTTTAKPTTTTAPATTTTKKP